MNTGDSLFGFKRLSMPYGGGEIDVYVSSQGDDFAKQKPLFLYSLNFGPVSIFKKTERGTSSCLFIRPELLNDNYHYVVITYPGVPFLSDGDLQESAQYRDAADLESFARANSAAIDFISGQEWVKPGRVVVCGASSGADIAIKVAAINEKVTHLACFAGCGLTQMYNIITDVRKKVRDGELKEEAGEREVSELYQAFSAIFSNPDAKDKHWGGHTYKLWHSFFNEPPVENLLRLNVPIYYAKGTEDASSGIEGTDIIPLEFVRHGKTNLTYKVWWGCDHSFNKTVLNAEGEVSMISLGNEVRADFLEWLKNQPERKFAL